MYEKKNEPFFIEVPLILFSTCNSFACVNQTLLILQPVVRMSNCHLSKYKYRMYRQFFSSKFLQLVDFCILFITRDVNGNE